MVAGQDTTNFHCGAGLPFPRDLFSVGFLVAVTSLCIAGSFDPSSLFPRKARSS